MSAVTVGLCAFCLGQMPRISFEPYPIDSGVSVLLGTGGRAFAVDSAWPVPGRVRDVLIAHLGRDRCLDVVTAGGGGAIAGRGIEPPQDFVRGDANIDGRVSISDAMMTYLYLFGEAFVPCAAAVDFDDDGRIDLSDSARILEFAMLQGPPPAPPYPEAGSDPTPDVLGCDFYEVEEAGETDDRIEIGVVAGEPGAEVEIPVYLTNSVAVDGYQLVLTYDPDVFTPEDVSFAGTFHASGDHWARMVAHPDHGIFVVGLAPGLLGWSLPDPTLNSTPPGTHRLVFKIRGAVSPDAPPGTVVLLSAATLPPLGTSGVELQNELSYLGVGRFVSVVPEIAGGGMAVPSAVSFVRGDTNADGEVDVSDVISIVEPSEGLTCRDTADIYNTGSDADGAADLFGYLFQGGLRPAQPYPSPGTDSGAADLLPCTSYEPTPPPEYAELSLGLEGVPAWISGAPGETKSFEVFATLTQENAALADGAQGWSLSFGVEGIVRIVEVTTAGTDVVPGSPQVHTVTVGDGNEGALSAVVLGDFSELAPLGPSGTARVLKLVLEATIPPEGTGEGGVSFVDGRTIGMAPPVRNIITVGGASHTPKLGSARVEIAGRQVPGDSNQDGDVDLSDAVHLLGFLYRSDPPWLACGNGEVDDPANLELLDWDGEAGIDLTDAVALLTFLFRSGPAHHLGTGCQPIRGCPAKCLTEP